MGLSILGKQNVLVVVPTEMERRHLNDGLSARFSPGVCGFGPIESGIETSRMLSSGNFDHVLLLGIAGSFLPDRLPPGSAFSFSDVQMDGIGVGESAEFQSASELGFGANDRLELLPATDSGRQQGTLLTVAAATDGEAQLGRRRERFPHAVAEDMEAWSVAFAARRAGLDTTVVRGISNVVGNRNHAQWQIEKALSSVCLLCNSLIH